MNTPMNIRFSAAFASIAITFCLLSTVAGMAKQPIGNVMLAQAAAATAVR